MRHPDLRDASRELAADLLEDTLEILAPFGNGAATLRKLTLYVVDRQR